MILYLEKRGCDFWEKTTSNVGNYRVGSYDYSIKGKNGRNYIIEFGGYDKKRYRYANKKTGRELKHPIIETVVYNALRLDTQFEDENGCWRDSVLETEMDKKQYHYTMEDILNAVNDISIDHYDEIQFI